MTRDEARSLASGYAWASEDITGTVTATPDGEPFPRGDWLFAQAYADVWDAYSNHERGSGPQPVRYAYARWQETGGRTIESEADERLAAARAARDAGAADSAASLEPCCYGHHYGLPHGHRTFRTTGNYEIRRTIMDTTVPATDISKQPSRDNDTKISVSVMRSCTFLAIRQDGRATGHYDISRDDWQKIAGTPRPQDDTEPAPEDPAARMRELERTIELLFAYGEARFGDDWWPGNARQWIPDGRELEYLLDPGSAELADREDTRSGEDHYA